MTNWVSSVIGFIVSLIGAVAIAWPVSTRTEDDVVLTSVTVLDKGPRPS